MEEHLDKDTWREEFTHWLEGFPWKWFCALTFRPGFSEAQARWRLRRWCDELRKALGTRDFEWIAVPERGRTRNDFHFHVLVAGLRRWHAKERLEWMRRWWKLAGDGRIDVYKPGIGGVPYVLKGLAPTDTDTIEIHLVSSTQQLQLGAK